MTDFADFMGEIEAEAEAEGPEAVAQLEAFREYFRAVRDRVEARVATPDSARRPPVCT